MYKFIPEEVFPKEPASLDMRYMNSIFPEEEKDPILNPPYNYNTHNPAPRKPSTEPAVTVKPIEQYTEEERLTYRAFQPPPEVRWDKHYNRINNKKTRKWYYKLKTGYEPEPKKKKLKTSDYDFDTSKWTFEDPSTEWKLTGLEPNQDKSNF